MSKLSKRLFTRVDTNQDSNLLVARTDVTQSADYGGAIDPNDINMKGFQALFAVIGALFVLGAIWFFFWAKNGGFKFRKGDWDDYKSTVLRRKGPNGTTLSNATKSTILGGGSVVGDGYSDRDMYADETSTVYTGTMTELSSSTAPIIKEKRNKKARSGRNETAKERKQREMKQANYEGGHDADVRAYMKEKPARVGGINAASDTMHYGTDYTETEGSTYSASHVGSHTHRQQQNQPPAPPSLNLPRPHHSPSQPHRFPRKTHSTIRQQPNIFPPRLLLHNQLPQRTSTIHNPQPPRLSPTSACPRSSTTYEPAIYNRASCHQQCW